MHYYMFYKPYGCVTARRDMRYPTVMDYFQELQNPDLSPVGRLDRETEGLLLITDDGKWNQTMIHPDHQVKKIYEFIAMGTWSDAKTEQLKKGILLTGAKSPTLPTEIKICRETILADVLPLLHPETRERLKNNQPDQSVICGKIAITEGKKRQIRRMLKASGCYVIFLKRISIGTLVLDPDLNPGEWKEIFPDIHPCNER